MPQIQTVWAEIANMGGVINWEHIPEMMAVVGSEEVGRPEMESLSLTVGGLWGRWSRVPTPLQFILLPSLLPLPHLHPS